MSTPKKKPRAKPKRSKPPTKRSELRSGFEFKVLKNLQESGLPFEYETETLPYTIPESLHKYTPDFIVKTKSGKKLYIEAKGIFDRSTRVKMLYVIKQNPKLDIRLLFMRNQSIYKGSRTKYDKWCRDRGIPCAVSENGVIPLEWLEE